MWNFDAEQPGDTGILTLDEELTIQRATELGTMLVNSLDRVNHLALNMEKVTGIDLSCLQLLCSAHTTSIKANKRLTVQGCPESLIQTMQDAGLSYVIDGIIKSEDRCLEIKGDN